MNRAMDALADAVWCGVTAVAIGAMAYAVCVCFRAQEIAETRLTETEVLAWARSEIGATVATAGKPAAVNATEATMADAKEVAR